MGKATGFMEYDRQDKKAEAPKERIRNFKEFYKPSIGRRTENSRSKMYVLWCTILSVRSDYHGNGEWMSRYII